MCFIGVEVKHEVRKFMLNAVKMVGSPLTFRASALEMSVKWFFCGAPTKKWKILDPTKNAEKNPTKNPRSAPGND